MESWLDYAVALVDPYLVQHSELQGSACYWIDVADPQTETAALVTGQALALDCWPSVDLVAVRVVALAAVTSSFASEPVEAAGPVQLESHASGE